MKKLASSAKQKKKRVKQTSSVKSSKKISKKLLAYIGVLFISLFVVVIIATKHQSITGLAEQPSPSPVVPTFYQIGDCQANNDCPTTYPSLYPTASYPTPTTAYTSAYPSPTSAYTTAYPTPTTAYYPTPTTPPTPTTYYYPTPTTAYSPTAVPTQPSTTITSPVAVCQTPTTNPDFTGGGTASNDQFSVTGLSVSQCSNTVAVIGITVQGNNTVSSVTLGSTTFTRVTNISCGGNNCFTELWYAINPQIGSNQTLAINITGDVDVDYGLATFSNVDPTNPIGTPAVETGDSASPSNSVSNTNTNQMIVDISGFTDTTATPGSGQNVIENEVIGTLWGEGSYKQGTTGSTSMSWTLASPEDWADIAVALNPVNSAPTTASPTINPCTYNTSQSTKASALNSTANSTNSNNNLLQLLIQFIQFLFQLLQNLFGGTTTPAQPTPTGYPTAAPTAYYYPTSTPTYYYPTPTTAYSYPTVTPVYYNPTPTTAYYYPTPTYAYPTQNPCPTVTPTPYVYPTYPPTPTPTQYIYPTYPPTPTPTIYIYPTYPPTATPKPYVYPTATPKPKSKY